MNHSSTGASQALERLEDALNEFTGIFEPGQLQRGQLSQALRLLGRAEKAVSSLGALVAAEMARAAQGPYGHARPLNESVLARQCALAWGVAPGPALEAVLAAKTMAGRPEVVQAIKAGRLSRPQATLVMSAAEVDPAALGHLLSTAATRPLRSLEGECQRIKALGTSSGIGTSLALPLADGRTRAADLFSEHAHRTRRLRSWVDHDGQWHMTARGTQAQGATILAAIAQVAEEANEFGPAPESREQASALAFDALVTLANTIGAAEQVAGAFPCKRWSSPKPERPVARPHASLQLPFDALDWLFEDPITAPTSTQQDEPGMAPP